MTSSTQAFAPDKLQHLNSLMQGYIDRGEVAGLVTAVCSGSETHIEAHGVQDLQTKTKMRADSIFRIASISKSITAAGAMELVEDGALQLSDSIFKWLPELQNMRVLRTLESELDDTVPMKRAITVHDLLSFLLGFGIIMAKPGTYPIQQAMVDAELLPNPMPPQVGPDEWLKKLASLPLSYQPGERWLYHTGSDVLGVLISRASGMSLETFLQERIFQPLGMKDTSFFVAAEKMDRFTTAYFPVPDNKLLVFDPAAGGKWSAPPAFESGGGGLVSTADDMLRFGRMMRDGGEFDSKRILKKETIAQMTTDQLTPAIKEASAFFPGFWDTRGWGFGMATFLTGDQYSTKPGRFGWDGGLGTSWFSHPSEDLVGVILTQRGWTSPVPPPVCADFWKCAYEAKR